MPLVLAKMYPLIFTVFWLYSVRFLEGKGLAEKEAAERPIFRPVSMGWIKGA